MANKKAPLVWTSDNLTPNLKDAHERATFYLSKTTEYYSLKAEEYARKRAKWTDRSGNARSGLASVWTGDVSSSNATFQIDIFHRVPYGIWLEIKAGGKWGIINRTIDFQGQKFFDTANKVMAKMFGGV